MNSVKKWFLIVTGVSAFLWSSLAIAKEISWTEINQALDLAKSKNKHLLIDFYSPT